MRIYVYLAGIVIDRYVAIPGIQEYYPGCLLAKCHMRTGYSHQESSINLETLVIYSIVIEQKQGALALVVRARNIEVQVLSIGELRLHLSANSQIRENRGVTSQPLLTHAYDSSHLSLKGRVESLCPRARIYLTAIYV